ncbi:MAG: prolyl oligopeptidase family serine peptidase [Armatimonadetes bacterium]|nr:prolyl oligopeptidase family serine peptidase [Armatimonadota bacterium]
MPHPFRPARLAAALLLFLLVPLPVRAGSAADSASVPVDPAFFDYDARAPLAATETPLSVKDGIRVLRVTYPSPVVTPFAANNTVVAFLFLPPGPGPHPAMIVLHEWLPNNLADEDNMCQAMAQAGVAALLVEQPYSLERRPVPHRPDAELLSGNLPQMVAGLRQAVIDARRGADWLQTRPDIDPKRLGIGGISLGGVLAPLVAGADSRLTVVLTVVGGADVADLIWKSFTTRGVHKGLVQRGETYQSLERGMAPFEAGRWLHHFNPDNALLFNGRDDFIVRPWQAEDMARALDGARIVWLNTGHYGPIFTVGDVEATGARFLRSRFFPDAPPFHAPENLPAQTVKLGFLVGGQERLSPALAWQVLNFDPAGRFSADAQLTLHGLSAALSARLNNSRAVGVEFPLLKGTTKPRPFILFHVVL